MSTLHALLIGVDHYFEHRLPGGVYYPKLGGCVRDINKIYSFLTTRLQLDPDHILKLTASLGDEQPPEPAAEWPTYRNMVNAFQTITERAQPGDQVYIQYSGHGGRTTTMFPALKGESAFDEGLVPLDIGKPDDPDARYLRDVEMHNLIQNLVDKEVRLTVVFDCCHSGGATRNAGGARKRGIGVEDKSPPPSDSAVGDLPDLIARWQGSGGGTTRSLQNQSSWLFEPQGYTLFAACRANESAFEFPFDGRESNGALTYWMLDTLAQSGPNTTWQMVADRVAAKVHGQFEQQVPMLQGEGNFRVFGADQLEARFGVPVLAVEPSRRRVRIGAGEVHGLAEGTRFAVYPSMADADDERKQQALIELTEIEATDSWATIVEPEGAVAAEVGSQAVMLNTTAVRVQRDVRVVIEDEVLRSRVKAAIVEAGQGFLALAEAGGGADFLVDVHEKRPDEYVLLDTSGVEIPHLRPALRVDDDGAISQLVQRLVHLAQYRNVQSLDMPDTQMAAKLQVEMEGKPVNEPGDTIKLKITNTQEPNPHNSNDPERILNITVLALSSDWSVSQIYPGGASPFEPLDPGQTLPLEFSAYLPEGQSESLDIIKVFATRSATNFRWLELPALDQPIQSKSAMRSSISDPLEQMLATVTQPGMQTRAVKLTSSPQSDRGWTVSQVEMRVVEEGSGAAGDGVGEESAGDDDAAGADDDAGHADVRHEQPPPLAPTNGATAGTSAETDVTPPVADPVPDSVQIDPRALGVANPDEFQIMVEFSEPTVPVAQPVARGRGGAQVAASQIEQRSQHAIRAAMNTIREMALQTDLMRQGIPGGSQPRMVKVKFGINLDFEVGAFLAKSGVGATMEVELEWARRSDDVLRVLRAETDVEGALFTEAEA